LRRLFEPRQSSSSNTPVSSTASEARDKNRGILMRRQSQRPATNHRPVHQLDLFGLPDPAGFDQPGSLWGVLP
jgi:hypothetical protein